MMSQYEKWLPYWWDSNVWCLWRKFLIACNFLEKEDMAVKPAGIILR